MQVKTAKIRSPNKPRIPISKFDDILRPNSKQLVSQIPKPLSPNIKKPMSQMTSRAHKQLVETNRYRIMNYEVQNEVNALTMFVTPFAMGPMKQQQSSPQQQSIQNQYTQHINDPVLKIDYKFERKMDQSFNIQVLRSPQKKEYKRQYQPPLEKKQPSFDIDRHAEPSTDLVQTKEQCLKMNVGEKTVIDDGFDIWTNNIHEFAYLK